MDICLFEVKIVEAFPSMPEAATVKTEANKST